MENIVKNIEKEFQEEGLELQILSEEIVGGAAAMGVISDHWV